MSVEVLPHVIDPRVPWTAAKLRDLISTTPDLEELPSARYDGAEGEDPIVILPNLGTAEDYVLRVNWRMSSNEAIAHSAQICTREFGLLGALASGQGIQNLVPAHSIFSGVDFSGAAQLPGAINPANIYTVAEKIGDGRTLADTLGMAQYEETHIALGRMILRYLGHGPISKNRLYDISGLDQYSRHPKLYNLQLLEGISLEGVTRQLLELQEWLSGLKTPEKLRLLDRAKRLQELFTKRSNNQ